MTTTATPTTTPPAGIVRRARAGTVGAVLWTLSPGVWAASEIEDQPSGSLALVAVAVAWAVTMVLAPALLVAGHTALLAAWGPAVGRGARAGVLTAAAGLAAMGIGIGIEIASMGLGRGEVPLGHAVLLVGFLVTIVGGVVTGIELVRRSTGTPARVAGWLLVLALPLGLGIGWVGALLAPGNDAMFWAVLTVPTGAAWVLLGRSLGTRVGSVR